MLKKLKFAKTYAVTEQLVKDQLLHFELTVYKMQRRSHETAEQKKIHNYENIDWEKQLYTERNIKSVLLCDIDRYTGMWLIH